MLTKNSKSRETAGSRNSNEPRRVGQIIIDDVLFSNEHPLGVSYRQRKLFKDFYPNTELDVDLKLLTRQPGRMSSGAYLDGAITRVSETSFCFIQNDAEKKWLMVTPRNPHIYTGKRINVNRRNDGTLYPTFNRPHYTKDFSFQDFCREAAEELLVVGGLIEE